MSLILNSGFTIGPGVILQNAYTIPVVSDGLILHLNQYDHNSWSGTGSIWTDISLNGRHAQFHSNPSQVGAGQDGPAILGESMLVNGITYFNGTSNSGVYQYASGTNLGTNITQWTVSTWFKLESFVSNSLLPAIFTGMYLGGGAGIDTVNFSLQFFNGSGNDNKLYAGFFDGSWRISSGYAVTTGQWYNAVASYDGMTLALYINNVQQAALAVSSVSMTSTLGYRVGRRWDGWETIDGYIPIVMVYNRALLESEITQNYNAHKGHFGL